MEQELLDYIRSIGFGEHNLTVKNYRNKPTSIDIHTQESVKYTNEPDNMRCFAQILQLLKQYEEDGFSGSMTFTVAYHKGKANTVLKTGFKRLTNLDS